MALQFDVTVRNARLDAVETQIGTLPVLKIRTGAAPANCATADAGTVLATCSLPSDWMNAAATGAKTMLGSWADSSADNAGTAAHFRIYDSGGTCRAQGTVTATGGGGDMTVDNVVFAAAQPFTITSFTLNEPNS